MNVFQLLKNNTIILKMSKRLKTVDEIINKYSIESNPFKKSCLRA